MSLRLILSDQLSHSLLEYVDKEKETLLFCEVMEEAIYVKHHKKKIAFLFAAMRHFADEVQAKGFRVIYIKLDAIGNTHSLVNEALRVNLHPISVVEPGEYRLQDAFKRAGFTLLPDSRFLATHNEFRAWSKGKKQLRMEYFYRTMRIKYHLLMEEQGEPTGGLWNYDKKNRKPPPKGLKEPKRLVHKKSQHLMDVLSLVEENFQITLGLLFPFIWR